MIIGERVRLRSIERADLPRFVEWLNDPDVRINLAAYLPMSMAREEMMKRPSEEHALGIEARAGETWKLIGSCGLTDINWQERSAELGIMIGAKDEWNKGYGTEAMRLLCKHSFETLNLYRLYLHVYDDNPRAIRSYEKVGFIHEGRLRAARYENGRYTDVLSMSVLRPEWDAGK
ncbi:MAG: GNAT family N-acetyltransferase [Anaerolineales bacterium]